MICNECVCKNRCPERSRDTACRSYEKADRPEEAYRQYLIEKGILHEEEPGSMD